MSCVQFKWSSSSEDFPVDICVESVEILVAVSMDFSASVFSCSFHLTAI